MHTRHTDTACVAVPVGGLSLTRRGGNDAGVVAVTGALAIARAMVVGWPLSIAGAIGRPSSVAVVVVVLGLGCTGKAIAASVWGLENQKWCWLTGHVAKGMQAPQWRRLARAACQHARLVQRMQATTLIEQLYRRFASSAAACCCGKPSMRTVGRGKKPLGECIV